MKQNLHAMVTTSGKQEFTFASFSYLLLPLDDSKGRKRKTKGLLWILLAKGTKRLDPLLATPFNELI